MHSLVTPGNVTDTESDALPSYAPHANIMGFRHTALIQLQKIGA